MPSPVLPQPQALNAAKAAYEALDRGADAQAVDLFYQALEKASNAQERFQLWADLGYLLDRLGRRGEAAEAFAKALDLKDDATLKRAFGYALLADGRSADAMAVFDDILKTDDALDPQTRLLLRRERRNRTQAINGGAFLQIRREPGSAPLTLAGPVLITSQGATDLSVSLRQLANTDLRVTGRALWAFEGATLNPIGESVQTGIGISWKPLSRINLIAGAERLVAVGDFARNDWLLRLSWSDGRGFESPGLGRIWPFWSVFADIAVIDPADPDWVAAGNLRTGLAWAVSQHIILRPFVAFDAVGQESFGLISTLYEAGPGLTIRIRLPGSATRASSVFWDLSAQWRQRIAGNSGNLSGLALTASFRF